MNLKVVSISMLFVAFATIGCNQKAKKENTDNTTSEEVVDTHTSKTSVNYVGTYQGVLPCADCDGMKTTIKLRDDNTYIYEVTYLGKNGETFKEIGKDFTWNEEGNKITLSNDEIFLVGENTLTKLDNNGAIIEGELAKNYILRKEGAMVTDEALTNKKWKLVTLMGKQVSEIGKVAAEPFIQFDTEGNRVHGNSGCNTFTGTYTLNEGNTFSTSEMVSTRKACIDANVETQFLGILQKADTYTIKDGVLSITKSRMAPLAVFELAE